MKIFGIIPARGGSKGVPKKNLKSLRGHPLIAYSIRASKLSSRISRTIVSTDSDEIAEIAQKYGAEVPFRRPAEISGDRSTDTEFVLHALHWFKENEGSVPDLLVHIRPTSPLRKPRVMDEAIDSFIKAPGMTALRSAHEMGESAYKTFEIDGGIFKTVCTGNFALDTANQARQSFPKTYSPNGYVDILKTSFVLEHQKIHGDRVMAFTTPPVIEVDSVFEFDLLDFLIQKDPEIFKNLFGET